MISVISSFIQPHPAPVSRWPFLKIVDVVFGSIKLFGNLFPFVSYQRNGFRSIEPSRLQQLQNIDETMYDRLLYVRDRIHYLAQRMKIGSVSIKFKTGRNDSRKFTTHSGFPHIYKPLIGIHIQEIVEGDYTDEEIDFGICHELCHIKKNHSLTCAAFNGLMIATNLVAFAFFPKMSFIFWAVKCFVVSKIVRSLESRVLVRYESLADLEAVKVLGTSQGGISYFNRILRINSLNRFNAPNDYDARGNYLRDHDHPILTNRIAALQQWQQGQDASEAG